MSYSKKFPRHGHTDVYGSQNRRMPEDQIRDRSATPRNLSTYNRPTNFQPNNSIEIKDRDGRKIAVEPVQGLKKRIEAYLPPSGPYYDYYALETVFGKTIFREQEYCVFCWMPRNQHSETYGVCRTRCSLCGNSDHMGAICDAIYVPEKFWTERQLPLPHRVQIRPNMNEFAYLVIAGVLKNTGDHMLHIKVEEGNEIVKDFYHGKAKPEPQLKKVKIPHKDNMKASDTANSRNTSSSLWPTPTLHPQLSMPNMTTSFRATDPRRAPLADRVERFRPKADMGRDQIQRQEEQNMFVERKLYKANKENENLNEKIAQLERRNAHNEEVVKRANQENEELKQKLARLLNHHAGTGKVIEDLVHRYHSEERLLEEDKPGEGDVDMENAEEQATREGRRKNYLY